MQHPYYRPIILSWKMKTCHPFLRNPVHYQSWYAPTNRQWQNRFTYSTVIFHCRPGFMIVLSVHPDNYPVSEDTFWIILKPGIKINKIITQYKGGETIIYYNSAFCPPLCGIWLSRAPRRSGSSPPFGGSSTCSVFHAKSRLVTGFYRRTYHQAIIPVQQG